MSASPFCTPAGSPVPGESPRSPQPASSPIFPIASSPPPSLDSFSSSVPLHQASVGKSFAEALCSGPAFEHVLGHRSNAFCHPIPDSFADFHNGSFDNIDPVKIKKPTRYNGMPCIFFTNEELDILDKPLALTLIAKFPAGRPKWVSLNRYFMDLRLIGGFKLQHLDSRHAIIHFKNLDDYTRVFAKPVSTIHGFAVKFLKWSREFDVNWEPSITPIWISLPNLCMHYFNRSNLFSIASTYGKPLILDKATSNGERPFLARILVELDVLQEHEPSIWLGNDEFGYRQQVIFENLPQYCTFCCKYGHLEEVCFKKNPSLKPIYPDGAASHGRQKRVWKEVPKQHPSMDGV